jgi:hypothetical protein
MGDCRNCPYATWDYVEYYYSTRKYWFVDGCEKDMTPEECEEEEQDEKS